MKKVLSLICLLFIIFSLSSCKTIVLTAATTTKDPSVVTLPDLTGMDREEINTLLTSLGIECLFGFDSSKYYGPNGYDTFIRYSSKSAGDQVKAGDSVRVLTSQLELPEFNLSELLSFNRDLAGKSFINDSYGYCTWAGGYVDGDTAYFIDNITGERFTLRFLCINTPEVSHTNIDEAPWGVAAQNYVYSILENAETIIVESEGENYTSTDIYGRYLGYVWVDGICLNLAVISEAYATYTSNSSDCKYDSVFSYVDNLVSATGRRFFGEYDPDFAY